MRAPSTLAEALASFEPVIGLEVHAQLKTRSKIFSNSSAEFEPHPNHAIDTYCLGLPGVLPKLNQTVVELAVRAGLAFECQIRRTSVFARKHYFYPDLPKGYQISQFDQPVCEHGKLELETDEGSERMLRITRIHLEEDAGKNVHDESSPYTLLDYNRAGVPLIEIVSAPDLRSAGEAARAFKAIHSILVAIGVCDGNMQEGSLRCDANVSIRQIGSDQLGTRCEIKNLNSFRFLEQAVESEILRQARLLAEGDRVIQETRLYDSVKRQTRGMRRKEEAHDYRYFPDPDLPPLVIPESWIEEAAENLPELPKARRSRYERADVPAEAARFISEDAALASLLDGALKLWPCGGAPLGHFIKGEVVRALAEAPEGAPVRISSQELATLCQSKDSGKLSSSQQKKLFQWLWSLETPFADDPERLTRALEKEGSQVADVDALEPIVIELVRVHTKEHQEYLKGKTKLLSFFIGQAMKRTQGKANPEVLKTLFTKHLGGAQ